jgi:hypothetical protein
MSTVRPQNEKPDWSRYTAWRELIRRLMAAFARATRLDPAFRPVLAGKYEAAVALLRERILLAGC